MASRRWYAMRSRLEREGRWRHRVPAQEEGEPHAKQPRADDGGDSPETDPEMPELEAPPTSEGMHMFCILGCLLLDLDSHYWPG